MARPRKTAEDLRLSRLPAPRLTVAELAQVEASAATLGMSLADFVRRRVLGFAVKPKREAADQTAIRELQRVGVNLNQIARALNRGRDLPPDLDATIAEVRGAVAEVARRGS